MVPKTRRAIIIVMASEDDRKEREQRAFIKSLKKVPF